MTGPVGLVGEGLGADGVGRGPGPLASLRWVETEGRALQAAKSKGMVVGAEWHASGTVCWERRFACVLGEAFVWSLRIRGGFYMAQQCFGEIHLEGMWGVDWWGRPRSPGEQPPGLKRDEREAALRRTG